MILNGSMPKVWEKSQKKFLILNLIMKIPFWNKNSKKMSALLKL